jgi:hypothetical protein
MGMLQVVHYFEKRYNSTCIRLDLPLVKWAVAMFLNDLDDVPAEQRVRTKRTTHVKYSSTDTIHA